MILNCIIFYLVNFYRPDVPEYSTHIYNTQMYPNDIVVGYSPGVNYQTLLVWRSISQLFVINSFLTSRNKQENFSMEWIHSISDNWYYQDQEICEICYLFYSRVCRLFKTDISNALTLVQNVLVVIDQPEIDKSNDQKIMVWIQNALIYLTTLQRFCFLLWWLNILYNMELIRTWC